MIVFNPAQIEFIKYQIRKEQLANIYQGNFGRGDLMTLGSWSSIEKKLKISMGFFGTIYGRVVDQGDNFLLDHEKEVFDSIYFAANGMLDVVDLDQDDDDCI
jgi:hypothetical protein